MDDGTAERWLPVVGYEGFYEVSDQGRIWSVPRLDPTGRRQGGRFLRPTLLSTGYLAIALCRAGKTSRFLVHRLVLTAFVGPCPEGSETRHLNAVRTDNRVANLAWGTSSENNYDIVAVGNHHYAKRDTCTRGHLLEGDNLRIEYKQDGSVKARRCRQCAREHKAEWAARKPPCSVCGAPQMALGLCNRHYLQQWAAAKKAGIQ